MGQLVTQDINIRLLPPEQAVAVSSVLQDAYRDERTFQHLFDGHRAGFEQRLRAFVREYTRAHLADNQSLLGLFVDDRLAGAALFCAPGAHRLQRISAKTRLALMSTVGLTGASRFIRYQAQLKQAMPDSPWCFLPLLGVLHEFRGQGLGRALLNKAWTLSDAMPESSGIALGSGAGQAKAFYQSLGFQTVGELNFFGTHEHFFFKAS